MSYSMKTSNSKGIFPQSFRWPSRNIRFIVILQCDNKCIPSFLTTYLCVFVLEKKMFAKKNFLLITFRKFGTFCFDTEFCEFQLIFSGTSHELLNRIYIKNCFILPNRYMQPAKFDRLYNKSWQKMCIGI